MERRKKGEEERSMNEDLCNTWRQSPWGCGLHKKVGLSQSKVGMDGWSCDSFVHPPPKKENVFFMENWEI